MIRRKRPLDGLDDDIAEHLERETQENIERGMTAEEARRRARLSFGNLALVKEDTRAVWVSRWLDDARQDAAYAMRTLRRSPIFASVVVLTLAVGIGANTAIFSVVNSVLLRDLSYAEDSDRLVRLMMSMPAEDSPTRAPLRTAVTLTSAEVAELRAHTRTLSHVGTAGPVLMGLSGREEAARLQGARVSSSVFHMLRSKPLLGRLFDARDDAPGAAPVVLLSQAAWQLYLDGDPDVLGRTLTFDSVLGPARQTSYTVVGVMPGEFRFPNSVTRFWVPFQAGDASGGAAPRGPVLGRLADGVSLATAGPELEAIVRELKRHPPRIRYDLVREHDELVAPVRPALLVLFVVVGFVLLIACVNVANLLLARSAARDAEVAIRAALGAGRGRLLRQALTESVMLTLLGGIGAGVLAMGGLELWRALATTLTRIDLGSLLAFPRLDEVEIDASVLTFTFITSLVTGLLVGLAPALRRFHRDLDGYLRPSAAPYAARSAIQPLRLRAVLVVAEIGMATVVVAGGGLLIHSFLKLSAVNPGYDPANLLTFQIALPAAHYPDTRVRDFAEELVDRLRAVPGVHAAAYANQLPMVALKDTAGGLWRVRDVARPPAPDGPDARFVSRDYLDAMGIRVIAGRGFRDADRPGRSRTLLINQTLAKRDFGRENPIGMTVFVGRDPNPWQIVGIVEDVRQFGFDREPEPQFFADLRQAAGTGPLFPLGAYYAVRTAADPSRILPDVRRIARQLEPRAALFNVAPMEELVRTSFSRPRMYAVLSGVFAGIAILLAVIGVGGLVAYGVAQRTREIGIRMALGARRSQVMALVLRRSLALTATGIGLGLLGAAAVARYLESLLFGLTPLDPITFGVVAAGFVTIATLASYLSALRATKIDPLLALRCE